MKPYCKSNYQNSFTCGLESPYFFLLTLSWTRLTLELFLPTTVIYLFTLPFFVIILWSIYIFILNLIKMLYIETVLTLLISCTFLLICSSQKCWISFKKLCICYIMKLIYLKLFRLPFLCSWYNKFIMLRASTFNETMMRLSFSRFFSHFHGRSISRNVASLIL